LSLEGKRAVLVCTGHGLKDPGIIVESFEAPNVIPAESEALMDLIGT
jgi:threonine synthase